jgi:hypothetical protein
MDLHGLGLQVSKTHSARVTRLDQGGWRLEIPAVTRHRYSLAQLDDHSRGRRSSFRWQPPLRFNLQARVSAETLPGTWGFGFWNDPFGFLLGFEGMVLRLPTLPEAAWFFHASPQNYLSFRDDLPANGLLAATFHSKKVPSLLLLLASPLMAFSLFPGIAQWVRKGLRNLIWQDATLVKGQLTGWHDYRMEWEANQVRFYLDGAESLCTSIVPRAPLSLVIWIDNQYAALPPRGRLRYGYLPDPEPAWLEIRDIRVSEEV